jgi:AcrR family transcriptional regulator
VRITSGTLYRYYPSKQDLLAELMTDALQPVDHEWPSGA